MKKIYFLALICTKFLVNAQIPTGAIGYWPFDNNALDMSGNNNNGTATNVTPYFDRFGNANKAYKFNGVNSKIVVPNNATIDMGPTDDFTIAFWEKAYSSVVGALVSKHISGTWNGFSFIAGNVLDPGYCTTPKHILFYAASGAQEDACSNTDLLKDSTWHFLVGTFKAATKVTNFYVDGILQNDIGGSSGVISNPANLSFGYDDDQNDGFFNGVLDGGRMYKRVLTSTEITNLYNESSTVGLNELSYSKLSISVAPNPSNGELIIQTNGFQQGASILVFNTFGQKVFEQELNSEQTLLQTRLDKGIYFYQLMQDNAKPGTGKLIIE